MTPCDKFVNAAALATPGPCGSTQPPATGSSASAVTVPATGPNQFRTITLSGMDTNGDSILDVTIADFGGDPYWVLNGLDIAEAAAGLPGSGGASVPAFANSFGTATGPDFAPALIPIAHPGEKTAAGTSASGVRPLLASIPNGSTEAHSPSSVAVASFRTVRNKTARRHDALDALFAAWAELAE